MAQSVCDDGMGLVELGRTGQIHDAHETRDQ